MTVNVKALKDFQKVWSPVIESIPQVLEAVAVQGNLDKAIQSKQAELDMAKTAVQEVFDKANQELDQLKADASKLRDERKETQDLIAADKSDAKKTISEMKDRASAQLATRQAKLEEVSARLSSVEAEYNEKADACRRNHSKLIEAQNEEIRELEKTKAQAEKALERLREKLG
jgi:chromosome segregation ATPase